MGAGHVTAVCTATFEDAAVGQRVCQTLYAKSIQQLTVPEHFNRPSGSSKWHVRLVAPKHVRPLVEQKEFRKSTGHSDLMRAKVVGHALITDKLREWDTLSLTLPPRNVLHR